ncbi:hypothetical protein BGZ46_000946, partial [Entomortierella lignicola]
MRLHGNTCTNLTQLKLSSTDDPSPDPETPSPPKRQLAFANVVRFVQKNPGLRVLNLRGRMFSKQKLSSISRLLNAIPITLESLTLSCMDGLNTALDNCATEIDDGDDDDHDQVNEGPLNISSIELGHSILYDSIIIPLLKRCSGLKMIAFIAVQTHISREVLSVLREHCPQLNTLSLMWSTVARRDEHISQLINASANGWKKISLVSPGAFGPLSRAALLKQATTLEDLRVLQCSGLDSCTIQELLCSASNLKRLHVLENQFWVKDPIHLDVQDLIQSRWVCDKLEILKIKISGIPRPDLRVRTNNRPLSGSLHEGDMKHSHSIQRRVYSQLGALTCLKKLVLGSELDCDMGHHALQWTESESEGEYYDEKNIQALRQYECLSFTLESGLDELRNLKALKILHLQRMSVGFGGASEQEWVRENWPELECAEGDWNYDGHSRTDEDEDDVY